MPSAMPADRAEVLSDRADAELPAVFLEQAREKIVETVMLFGQWPQPRPASPFRQVYRPVKFTLYDYLFDDGADKVDPAELREFFVFALTDTQTYGEFHELKSKWERKITWMLEEYFGDENELVIEVASELWDDEKEQA